MPSARNNSTTPWSVASQLQACFTEALSKIPCNKEGTTNSGTTQPTKQNCSSSAQDIRGLPRQNNTFGVDSGFPTSTTMFIRL